MLRVSKRAGLTGAALMLAMLGGVSTAYGSAPVPPATAPAGAAGETQLSAAELAAQITQAEALANNLARSNTVIAAAAAQLDRLSKQANTLLQTYATARDEEQKARAEASRNLLRSHQLSTQAGRDRQALGRWAYQTYVGSGGTLGDVSALLEALGKSPEESSDTAAQLAYLSDQRTSAFERIRDQAQLQRNIAARAVEASARATKDAAKAADAKKRLDVVMAQQRGQLDATRDLHAAQVAQAGAITGLLLGSGDARAVEASRRLRTAMISPGVVVADSSVKPCSDNEQPYPNGQITAAGLCPLYGAPGQSLRPSAAAAFNALSLAYQRDTGSPICVTDSYRSLAEQVAVKASRGMWAATPGTSEHGLGRAVDLCGGINDFGSPAHLWMRQNAPLYGWFHPDWAEPAGALPEPWHWEYAR